MDRKAIAAVLAVVALFGLALAAIGSSPAAAQATADTEVDQHKIEGESLHGYVDNITGEVSGEIEWGMIEDGASEAKIEVRPNWSSENITDRTIDLNGEISGSTTFEGLEFRMIGNAFNNAEEFHVLEDGEMKTENLSYDVVVTIYDRDGDRQVQLTDTHRVTVEITNTPGPDYVPGGEVDTELDAEVEMIPEEELSDWQRQQSE